MSLLIKSPVFVELEIVEHHVPSDGHVCITENHDNCDWKALLKEGLEKLYHEIQITDPVSIDNKISFSVSYSNRSAGKSDVAYKLDQFFRYNPMMAVKSVHLSQKQSL